MVAAGLAAAVAVVALLWPSSRTADEPVRGMAAGRDPASPAQPASQPSSVAVTSAPAIPVTSVPTAPTAVPAVDESDGLDAAGASPAPFDPTGAAPTSTSQEPADDTAAVTPGVSPTGVPPEEIPRGLPVDALDQSPTSVPWQDRGDAVTDSSSVDSGPSPTQAPDSPTGPGR